METIYPTTRGEAKRTGAKYYFTGLPCKHGHVALRKTKGVCLECERIAWGAQAETRREYFKQYAARPEVKGRQHDWYLQHKEQTIERAQTTPAEKRREYQGAWKRRNIDKVRADTKSRRRKHRDATPPWLTPEQKKQIREIYVAAIRMSKITGEQYVVDHIFPLRSDVSCGLHVPWNLRIITRRENLEKSNKVPDARGYAFDPDFSV